MKRNTTWFYLFVLGVALVAPKLMQRANSAKTAAAKHAASAAPASGPAQGAIVTSAPASAPPRAALPEQIATLSTSLWTARVSSLNGGLKSFVLRDPRFQADGQPLEMVTTSKPAYYPLGLQIDGAALDTGAGWQMQQLSEQRVRFHLDGDGLGIERKLEAGAGPYQVWVTTTVQNRGTTPRKVTLSETTFHYVTRKAESGGIPFLPARSSALSNGLCHHGEDFERVDRKKLEETKRWSGVVRYTGIDNVYFLNAIVAADKSAESCVLDAYNRGTDADGKPIGTLYSARLSHAPIVLGPSESKTVRVLAYLGPKTPQELARVGHELHEAINSGFFTSVADVLTQLLSIIHGFVGNWGLAIILLTFLVKAVLYPLTHKQMESMAKMKELKPEMDRINELYADDREKKGAAVMELYRKKGVNPMAGCFPVLLQLPIWFSLYASLSSNIQLFHAPFALWFHDLSSPDPYFVLPLCLGVLMFVQQKIAPPTGSDPMQAKMMLYMMPTMITSFMLFLPAGLCLYMFTNSALSIMQQRYIESRLREKQKLVSATALPSPSPKVAQDDDSADPVDPVDKAAQAGSKSTSAQRRLRRGRK